MPAPSSLLVTVDVPWTLARPSADVTGAGSACSRREADARTRTGDPFITSEVLYQLSYVGVCPANRLFFDLTYAAF